MRWKQTANETRYLELIASMTVDSLIGKGADTRSTFTANLRVIAEQLDAGEKYE